MNLKSMIDIGEKIEIIFEREHSEALKGFSMIQDITHEEELIITLPIFQGRPILLNPEDSVKISFFKDEGSFCFDGVIIKRFRIKNAVVVSVKQITPVRKIQRREFYRLKVVLPVEFTVLEEEKKPQLIKGYSIDISGNGLRLNTDYKMDVNTVVECSIGLNDGKRVLVQGKVVRASLADSLAYKYDLGISFENVTDRTRDILVKFIFKEQRKLRKKGFI